MKISNYRKDIRTKEEFEKDIKLGNEKEKEIARIFKENYLSESDIFEENGCDMNGELLDEKYVNTKADYILNGDPIEIKFNNNKCNVFHIKESQLNSYIKQKANILWVNNYMSNEAEYVIFDLEMLKYIKDKCKTYKIEKWGNKKAKRLYYSDYNWNKFK